MLLPSGTLSSFSILNVDLLFLPPGKNNGTSWGGTVTGGEGSKNWCGNYSILGGNWRKHIQTNNFSLIISTCPIKPHLWNGNYYHHFTDEEFEIPPTIHVLSHRFVLQVLSLVYVLLTGVAPIFIVALHQDAYFEIRKYTHIGIYKKIKSTERTLMLLL